jgi:hypothetical protein
VAKVFFSYFGVSYRKHETQYARVLGIRICRDNIVFIGCVVDLIFFDIGFWIHKKGYVIGGLAKR